MMMVVVVVVAAAAVAAAVVVVVVHDYTTIQPRSRRPAAFRGAGTLAYDAASRRSPLYIIS